MYVAGFYRFGTNEKTAIRCVYVSCNDDDVCIFTSPEDGTTELQISMQSNPLHSGDNCVVNNVEIIHDCMPRNVDLTLKFTSYPGNDNLYLQVRTYVSFTMACTFMSKYLTVTV